ncbi:hypothetical protein [Limosilactobacillus fermentum]|uniref:hypothetical protein n=1 Tax=Limosilactobacillus fermentum TaxID=1613 RepID=UPI0031CCF460
MLYKQIILEWGQDTESGVWGLGYSPDNGKNFYVLNTTHGRKYRAEDGNRLYPYISDQVQDKIETVVAPAESAANSAVAYANDAIEKSRVNSQAIVDINSAVTEAKQGANDAMSRAKIAWDVATGAKASVTEFDPLLKSAQSDAGKALAQIADTASALSDAKTAFGSDVAVAKNLANTAQSTADNAVKSASSVADDLTKVASQAKANADGITKVTSDVGLLQTTVADNSGNISKIQETAKQIQQAVSDNAGNITAAKQTADSAVTVASDARSNATVASQTASQASITAKNASGQAASAVLTANGAMTTASDAKSNATVAVQTASGASLTATNAKGDATVAKQTASEAKVQASNAESDFAQISIRAGKIEASVANNSGAIASVQQTANGLTTTVGKVDDRVKKIEDTTNWTTKTGVLDMDTLTTTQNIYYRDTNLKNADGETGWAYIQVVSIGERVTQTVWHDRSNVQHTRTGALNSPNSNYNWDAWNEVATYAQVVEVKKTVDGITTIINDPKTGLNATYQTAAGNATTISNVKSDVYQLEMTAHGLTSRVGNLESKTNTQETAIEQYKNAVKLKANQIDVDTLKGNVTNLQAESTTQADEIKNKVTRSDVTGMLTGYATQDYTQSLVTLKADEWNVNLTKLKKDTQNSVTNLSATVDGIKGLVETKAGQSEVTQLSNLVQSKVSSGDFTSTTTQLKNMINQRVQVGNVISQINQEAGGDTLIQVSNGKGSFVLDASNTIMTGKAWIPDAAISSISADKIMLGSSSLYNSDGTLNLVNQSNNLKALIQVKQGLVQNTTQSIISFSSDYNNRAFSVTPVGATITPTLFFERYDQTAGHWLGFTRNEVRRDGLMFHTWDDEGERFFVGCHARFDRNISVDGTINQGTWNGTSGKPEAGILTIKSGNTIWSGSDFLAIGDHISNSFTNVMARSFSQQSTLSSKTNIEAVDPKYALDLVNRTDILSYQYKADVAQGKTKRYTSMILDDVNDVSKYYAPDEFANEERTGRDDGSAVGYLFLAVQELTRRIKNLEEKLHE